MALLFPGCELTPREQEVVALLMEGCENQEIAKELGVERRTVKAYLNRLYLRYGITEGIKRVKLARFMYRRQRQALAMLAELAKQQTEAEQISAINPS